MKKYTLTNNSGILIDFFDLGGRINSIKLPTKTGYVDIITGFDDITDMKKDFYMGAICGRYANRIDKGTFVLNGIKYFLYTNLSAHHLHGGNKGFSHVYWSVEKINLKNFASAYRLTYISRHGEEGYPGNVLIEVIYSLNDYDEFIVEFKAVSDRDTIINLTLHPYFNLKGYGNILDHKLFVNARSYTPIREDMIPTGEIKSVVDTSLFLNGQNRLEEHILSNDSQIKIANGLDHNFVINKKSYLDVAAELLHEDSNRKLIVMTTQPGVQIYSASHFDKTLEGKNGLLLEKYCGIAIEPQNFPDAPNKKNFPSAILRKKEIYRELIIYKFVY